MAAVAALVMAAAANAEVSPLALDADADTLAVNRACQLLSQRLASVKNADCKNAGLKPVAVTRQGRTILLRDYPAADEVAPLRVLLIGGIHGDELSSTSIVLQWMQKQIVRASSRAIHWRVVPCLNPDGLLARPARRTNGRGVDVNRNFATPDWTELAHAYWERKTRKDPRRYPGTAAASEPETQWLQNEIAAFAPHAVVQVHAPYGLLDYDGPRTPPRNLGFLDLRDLGIYPGSLGNYAGEYLGIPTLTLELPNATSLPSSTQSAKIWDDLLRWLDKNRPDPVITPDAASAPVGLR